MAMAAQTAQKQHFPAWVAEWLMHSKIRENWCLVLRRRRQEKGLQLLTARSSPMKSSRSASSLVCYIITFRAVSRSTSSVYQIPFLAGQLNSPLPNGR
jgi:hypothetical protein